MRTRRKVVFLGFCSGNRALIRRWAEAGLMPTFQRLFASGVAGETAGLPGFFVGSTWPSIYTAVSPARHGRHYQTQIIPGSYELDDVPAGERVKRPPFWQALSDAGRRVAILDIPHASPARDLNGIQLAAWDLHDADYPEPRSWPESLAVEVMTRFGVNPAGGACDAWRSTEQFIEFRRSLLAGVERKLELTRHFLKQDDWDFFAQVFTEGHCAGHQCWHFHDPRHPRHEAESAKAVGDPLRDAYVAIDRAFGAVLGDLDEDTTVIVAVSHGMGPKYSADAFVERILHRLGLGELKPEKERRRTASRLGALDPVVTRLYQKLPQGLRDGLRPMRNSVRSLVDRDTPGRPSILDPAASRCFGLYNNAMHSGVRVNLRGREPRGRVSPGAELEALLDGFEADLHAIVNLDTGRPIVRRVVRTARDCPGEYEHLLPDVSIEWNNESPVFRIGSPKIGELEDLNRASRTGDHFPGGLVIACGPGIRPGRIERPLTVMDIAPTIAAALDVPLPDVDGRPIPEICEPQAR